MKYPTKKMSSPNVEVMKEGCWKSFSAKTSIGINTNHNAIVISTNSVALRSCFDCFLLKGGFNLPSRLAGAMKNKMMIDTSVITP